MKAILCSCAMLLLVPVGSVQAQGLMLYDDFSAPLLNPDKWISNQSGYRTLESLRLIQGNQLRLDNRAYGDTGADTGSTFSVVSLVFTNPNAVTAIQSTVTASDVSATSCPTNPDAYNAAEVAIAGNFFNTATPIPGSNLGDVTASIFLIHSATDPPTLLHAAFFLAQCGDDSCGALFPLDYGDLGTVTTGQAATLLIQWDQPNHQFIFQRDTNPPVLSQYTVLDGAAPGNPYRAFSLLHGVANCTSAPRPAVFMSALFGNVFVNQSTP